MSRLVIVRRLVASLSSRGAVENVETVLAERAARNLAIASLEARIAPAPIRRAAA
jgi:hypothetical protein